MPHRYIATFVTGNVAGSGTDSEVKLTLKGTSGEVEKKFLGKYQVVGCPDIPPIPFPPDHCNGIVDPFEKGTHSTFDIDANEFIGEITEISIEVNDSRTNDNPAWYLQRVDIHTYAGGSPTTWKFPVERWIGTGKDPHHKEEQVNNLRVNQSGPIT